MFPSSTQQILVLLPSGDILYISLLRIAIHFLSGHLGLLLKLIMLNHGRWRFPQLHLQRIAHRICILLARCKTPNVTIHLLNITLMRNRIVTNKFHVLTNR